ncbi:MAG: sugar ABC transporter permease [Candidatus Marinimicrobia bacterium]|nr:sugar ABC transporter permease [Candidatus Neomarinimicrobiota bacterium]
MKANTQDKSYLFKNRTQRRDFLDSMLFLSPSLLVFFVFIFLPIAIALYLSLMKWDLLSADKQFVGLKNYIYYLKNPFFYKVLLNTLYYAAVRIPLDLVISLSLALLLNKKLRGLSFYRTIYFVPVISSMVAVSAVWIWIYEPESGGLANYFLNLFGISPVAWLNDPHWAMPAIIIMSVWKGLGYNIIIFLAGLQNIPDTYYEAARVDGANSWQQFRRVTLPLLSPITYFVVLMGIINSFKVFTQIEVMTPEGGPLNSTSVLVFYLYQEAFHKYRFGRASALAFILFIIVIIITKIQRSYSEKRVHYQ